MPFETSTWVSRSSTPMTAAVDQELVILGMATSHYIGLDAVGRRIWELLAAPIQVSSLCQHLSQEFQGPATQITTDVLGFLESLAQEGLVNVHPPQPE